MGCWTYYCIKSRRDFRRHCVYVPSFEWLRFSMWVSGVHVQYFFTDDELKLVDMYLLENVRLDNEQKCTMNILNPRLNRDIWYSVPVSFDYKNQDRRKIEIIITVIWCLKLPATRFFSTDLQDTVKYDKKDLRCWPCVNLRIQSWCMGFLANITVV